MLVENALFATLDPTVRRAETVDGRIYTLADTVGFVRSLPHQLVEAFRSTLEEVADADLILHVVDASHPDPEGQIAAVRHVFADIPGAMDVPEIIVLNKADLAPETIARLRSREVHSIVVSAHSGEGIEELQALVRPAPRPGVSRPRRPVPPRRPDQPGARARRHPDRGAHGRRHGDAGAGGRRAWPRNWRRRRTTRLTRCRTTLFEDLLDVAVRVGGRACATGQHQMAVAVARDDREGRAPARPGRHGHREVARLPRPRGAARRPGERARGRLHRHARAPAPDHDARPPARREGPRAAPAAAASIALLKGWHNYVCVHKVAGGYPEDDAAACSTWVTTPAPASTRRPGRRPRTSASRCSDCGSGPRSRRPATATTSCPAVTDRAWRQVSVAPWSAWDQSARCSRVLPARRPRRRRGRPTSS